MQRFLWVRSLKVAIVHDWLTGMRGGEKCLEAFCELFPEAEIYTLLHVRGAVCPTIEKHSIRTSFVQWLPFSSSRYRYYLPLFPSAIETFDLRGYDLVISSSHCVAKGVCIPDEVYHFAYIYTPMRYIWDQYDAYSVRLRQGCSRGLLCLCSDAVFADGMWGPITASIPSLLSHSTSLDASSDVTGEKQR